MKPILFSLFNTSTLANNICTILNLEMGSVLFHKFPDDEVILQINSELKDRSLIVLADLSYPNKKLLSLIFFSETARELGAKSIALVSPYLPYMRQDARFKKGQSITSRYFAALVSRYFDCLITIDPHLHRYPSLDTIYSIPSYNLQTADSIAKWISQNVKKPLLIGPDIESTQWVKNIALGTSTPYSILNKNRHGDNQVELQIEDLHQYSQNTPVLVDDIISTGITMAETIKLTKAFNMPNPICIGIHAIFANQAYEKLLDLNARVVTCNTIAHESNAIEITPLIVSCIKAINELN